MTENLEKAKAKNRKARQLEKDLKERKNIFSLFMYGRTPPFLFATSVKPDFYSAATKANVRPICSLL